MDYKTLKPFPEGFLWGASSSAYQCEGAYLEDGKTLSVSDTAPVPEGTTDFKDGIDHYHRFREDIALMAEMGFREFRFSIAWPRIIPDGTGEVNPEGIAYYRKLLTLLKENGIVPNATMFHWDLPYALQVKGGFGNRKMIEWFLNYANVLLDNFGEDIKYWVTFNEPIATYVGNAKGFFAPGLSDDAYARQCCHNLLVCHGETVKLFRSKGFRDSKIGIVVDVWKHYPADADNEEDVMSAMLANETEGYGMFLHPLFIGGYSDYLNEYMTQNSVMPEIMPGDFETIRQTVDFYGMNFYNVLIDDTEKQRRLAEEHGGGGNYQNRPEYHTELLGRVLREIIEEYRIDVPLLISENGIPQVGLTDRESILDDQERIEYVEKVLKMLHGAIQDGIDVRGYYLWSLMDNFEWSAGYEHRFGLYYTDFDTLELISKKSAGWYADVISNNGLFGS
jgi:beta-glucosidase